MSEISHVVVPRSKIDACCDSDSSRFALGSVEIIPAADEGSVYCTATDGRVASITLAEGNARGIALLPMKFSKPGKAAMLNGRWECDGKVKEPGVGRFPRIQDVLPEVPATELSSWGVLGIRGSQFKRLAEAIGHEDEVVLFIPPNGEKGYVDRPVALRGAHGIGVVMPIVVDKAAHEKYEAFRLAYSAQRQAVTEQVAQEAAAAMAVPVAA